MLKYIAVAAGLKFFSLNPLTKRVYRAMGNSLGGRQRATARMPDYYLQRIKWKTDLCRKYNMLQPGDSVLELGTGWVHWEAVTLRLFYDVQVVCYDVWDNRQLSPLKSFLTQVDAAFDGGYRLDGMDVARARRLIRDILEVNSFEELYRLLGFRYVVDAAGSMKSLENETFQLVMSGGVFEHIYREILPDSIAGWTRLMRPGAFAIHTINISDHLYLYDRSVCPKQYLGFSERVWKRFFENDVQYINRVQRGEWLGLFERAGLMLREESGTYADLGGLKIDERYASMDAHDLSCTHLEVVLQKPVDGTAARR
jgi:hypothetical protein